MSLIWLEIALGFGAPLAWGVWELHALRRDRRAAARRAAGADANPATHTDANANPADTAAKDTAAGPTRSRAAAPPR